MDKPLTLEQIQAKAKKVCDPLDIRQVKHLFQLFMLKAPAHQILALNNTLGLIRQKTYHKANVPQTLQAYSNQLQFQRVKTFLDEVNGILQRQTGKESVLFQKEEYQFVVKKMSNSQMQSSKKLNPKSQIQKEIAQELEMGFKLDDLKQCKQKQKRLIQLFQKYTTDKSFREQFLIEAVIVNQKLSQHFQSVKADKKQVHPQAVKGKAQKTEVKKQTKQILGAHQMLKKEIGGLKAVTKEQGQMKKLIQGYKFPDNVKQIERWTNSLNELISLNYQHSQQSESLGEKVFTLIQLQTERLRKLGSGLNSKDSFQTPGHVQNPSKSQNKSKQIQKTKQAQAKIAQRKRQEEQAVRAQQQKLARELAEKQKQEQLLQKEKEQRGRREEERERNQRAKRIKQQQQRVALSQKRERQRLQQLARIRQQQIQQLKKRKEQQDSQVLYKPGLKQQSQPVEQNPYKPSYKEQQIRYKPSQQQPSFKKVISSSQLQLKKKKFNFASNIAGRKQPQKADQDLIDVQDSQHSFVLREQKLKNQQLKKRVDLLRQQLKNKQHTLSSIKQQNSSRCKSKPSLQSKQKSNNSQQLKLQACYIKSIDLLNKLKQDLLGRAVQPLAQPVLFQQELIQNLQQSILEKPLKRTTVQAPRQPTSIVHQFSKYVSDELDNFMLFKMSSLNPANTYKAIFFNSDIEISVRTYSKHHSIDVSFMVRSKSRLPIHDFSLITDQDITVVPNVERVSKSIGSYETVCFNLCYRVLFIPFHLPQVTINQVNQIGLPITFLDTLEAKEFQLIEIQRVLHSNEELAKWVALPDSFAKKQELGVKLGGYREQGGKIYGVSFLGKDYMFIWTIAESFKVLQLSKHPRKLAGLFLETVSLLVRG